MFGPQRVLLDRLASASGPLVTMPRERQVVLALVRKRFAVIETDGVSITELGRAEHARILGPARHRDLSGNWAKGGARRGKCCGRQRELAESGLPYCKSCGRTAQHQPGTQE